MYACVQINESNINMYFLLMHNYKVHTIYIPYNIYSDIVTDIWALIDHNNITNWSIGRGCILSQGVQYLAASAAQYCTPQLVYCLALSTSRRSKRGCNISQGVHYFGLHRDNSCTENPLFKGPFDQGRHIFRGHFLVAYFAI